MNKSALCCFGFHDWTRWEDDQEVELRNPSTDELVRKYIVQDRRCNRCNRLEYRQVHQL